MYDIEVLCQRSDISEQTFYRLAKKDDEFRELVEQERKRIGKRYRYSEKVLEWLLEYSDISSADSMEEDQTSDAAAPVEPSADPAQAIERDPLTDKINVLENEIAELKSKLESTEQERKALFLQNSQLLCLLAQEKQEKQALLPVPKKPLLARIKDILKKETLEN